MKTILVFVADDDGQRFCIGCVQCTESADETFQEHWDEWKEIKTEDAQSSEFIDWLIENKKGFEKPVIEASYVEIDD